MIAAFSPFLALRYLLTRRINLLGVLGVMFAVWAMLIVDAVFTGFVSNIRREVKNSAVELIVSDLPNDTAYPPLRDAIAAAGGADVVAQAPRLRHFGLLQQLGNRVRPDSPPGSSQVDFDHTNSGFAMLVGIDPDAEARVSELREWIANGPDLILRHHYDAPVSKVLDERDAGRRALLQVPDEDEWLQRRRAGLPAEQDVANYHSVWPGVLLASRRYSSMRNLAIGDPIELMCASFTGSDTNAVLHTQNTRLAFAGWLDIGNRFDEATVLLPIETLRTLLGNDAMDEGAIELVTDVALKLRDGITAAETTALQARLSAAVQRVLGPTKAPCSVLDWQQQNPVFLGTVAHEQALMQFVLLVVMLVAAFVIYATLHMMVVQKVKDIGILAAVGGSPRAIGAVFLVCGFVVAATGALLGVGLGALSAAELNTVNDWMNEKFGVALFPPTVFDLREVPVRLEPAWAAGVAIAAVLLSLLVALVPSRKAARMNPVEALSYE